MSDPLNTFQSGQAVRVTASLMRLLIGWHLLYEGLNKVFDTQWSAGPFLVRSSWLLSDFFRWIAESPSLVKAVDLFNMWGLTMSGLALMLGLYTRTACIAGALLLALYFVANPPLLGYSFGITEGNYLGVDKNLIEIAALIVLSSFPFGALFGLDRLLELRKTVKSTAAGTTGTVPVEDNSFELGFGGLKNRRELLKNLTVVPVVGGFFLGVLKRHGWQSYEEKNLLALDSVTQASVKTVSASTLDDLKSLAPRGRLGDLDVSRLICGGNLISGFAHARDLIYVSSLLKSYFTDEKVIETLWLSESCGINTAILRTDQDTVRVLTEYWKRGGKIQWLAQVYPKEEDLTGNIDLAVNNGAVGAFVQGNIADTFVKKNRVDLVEKSVEYIQGRQLLAGTAGHAISTVAAVEEAGIDVDFYLKTLHHTDYWSSRREDQHDDVVSNKADNYWEMSPRETVEYMEGVGKPWIAYKVLAAGAITPKDGFKYAFDNGADFACVGMFDFQVVDNVNTLNEVFSRDLARRRPWMA